MVDRAERVHVRLISGKVRLKVRRTAIELAPHAHISVWLATQAPFKR